MKKKILYVSAALLLTVCAIAVGKKVMFMNHDLFENIEALTDNEASHYGHCREKDYSCMVECDGCGELIIAVGDHTGPAYGITCPFCGKEIPD